jgi:hypothetical protein
MMPNFSIVVRCGFAGAALRLAAERAATFFFAAFVFEGFVVARFGLERLDALVLFALRLAAFFGAVLRDEVFRLGDRFAMLRIL